MLASRASPPIAREMNKNKNNKNKKKLRHLLIPASPPTARERQYTHTAPNPNLLHRKGGQYGSFQVLTWQMRWQVSNFAERERERKKEREHAHY
jgi:hypothetical protein